VFEGVIMARPTKYTKKIGEHVQTLLSKGYSNRVAAGLVHIDESTFYDWVKNNPKFSLYVKEGRANGEKHYIDNALRLADGHKGSAEMLKFLMKNIYRWKENPDETQDTKPININFTIKEKPDEEE